MGILEAGRPRPSHTSPTSSLELEGTSVLNAVILGLKDADEAPPQDMSISVTPGHDVVHVGDTRSQSMS